MFLWKCLLPRTLRGENYFPQQNARDSLCVHASHRKPLFLRNLSFAMTGKKHFSLPISVRAGLAREKHTHFSLPWLGPSRGNAGLAPDLLLGIRLNKGKRLWKSEVRGEAEGRRSGVKSLSLTPRPGPGDARAPLLLCEAGGGGCPSWGLPPAFRKKRGGSKRISPHLLFQVSLAQNNPYAEV